MTRLLFLVGNRNINDFNDEHCKKNDCSELAKMECAE